MIQISAPIEPGDSGGPLVELQGRGDRHEHRGREERRLLRSGPDRARRSRSRSTTRCASCARSATGKDSDTVHVGDRGILGVQVQTSRRRPRCNTTANFGCARRRPPIERGPADNAGLSGVRRDHRGRRQDVASTLGSQRRRCSTYHPGDKVDVGWVDHSGSSHSRRPHPDPRAACLSNQYPITGLTRSLRSRAVRTRSARRARRGARRRRPCSRRRVKNKTHRQRH